jgi:PAS domain S-box-containing protein
MSAVEQNPQQHKMTQKLNELEEKERLFQSVLDGLPDAIEIIDRNFNVLYLNAAAEKRTGRGIQNQKGEKCHRVFYNREEPCTFCPAKKTFEEGQPGYVLLKDVQVRSTEPCFEELLSLPIKTEGEEIKWVVEIAKDVTKEKEMEQQLINSERLVAIGEMAALITHEFNNPLGIILGFTQDLLTEVEPSDPRHQSLKIIEEEARRCKKLMRDLLEFGRPTPAQFVHIDAAEVVRKSIDLVSNQLQKAKVRAVVDISNDLPKIWADPQQLEQVLVNLFFNAMEAMPEGGTLKVHVTTRLEDFVEARSSNLSPTRELVLGVTDTGHGISANNLPKIFHTFFTTKQKKGMGLGLSICQSIVKAHGGKIVVESSPGQGTTFYLCMPIERRRSQRNEPSRSR